MFSYEKISDLVSNGIQTDNLIFSNQNIKKALEPFLRNNLKIKSHYQNKFLLERKSLSKIKLNKPHSFFNNQRNNEQSQTYIFYPEKFSFIKTRNKYNGNNNLDFTNQIIKSSSPRDSYKVNNIDLISDFHLNSINYQETLKNFKGKKNYLNCSNSMLSLNNWKNRNKIKGESKIIFNSQKIIQNYNENIISLKLNKLNDNYPIIKSYSIEDNYKKKTIDPELFNVKPLKEFNITKRLNMKKFKIKKNKIIDDEEIENRKIRINLNDLIFGRKNSENGE
jgi:hypothetical protein